MTPHYLPSGDGETLHVLGETIHFKVTGETTSGAFTIAEEITPPGGGPPVHVHTREDEAFYILEGECTFTVADETMVARQGDFVFAPRNVPHTFKNTGAGPSRMLITITPAGFEEFFRRIDAAFGQGPPDPERLGQMAGEFGLSFL